MLELEDLHEEYPMSALDVPISVAKTTKAREICEVDDGETEFEEVFQLYCFFADLHALEEEVTAAWQRHHNRSISLNAVTLITQAAITSVRRLEKDALAITNPKEYPLANLTRLHFDAIQLDKDMQDKGTTLNLSSNQTSKHPYANVALPVFYDGAIKKGDDTDELLNSPKILERQPWHDFIYLPTFFILLKFADLAYRTIADDMNVWPLPVPPMRMSYIAKPELLELPGYKEREDDDTVLTQLLLDVFLMYRGKMLTDRFKYDDKHLLLSLPDEFAKGAKNLWRNGIVGTSTVFTCKLVLNILKVSKLQVRNGRPPVYVGSLNAARDKVDHTIAFINRDEKLDTRDLRWLNKDNQLLLDLHMLVDIHIPDRFMPGIKTDFASRCGLDTEGCFTKKVPPRFDALVRQRMLQRGEDPDPGPTEEHDRNAEKLNIRMIKENREPDFFRTHSPLYCGTLSLDLAIKYEEAGIGLSNHHLTSFAVAHF